MIRLDRFVSENYPCTRSLAKKLIVAGKCSVDGKIVRTPDFKLDEAGSVVCEGRELKASSGHLYYMLNKPADVISATEDRKHKTVIDLFPETLRKKLFPVGRLDIDTEGLLLVTDDGDFCHRIESPKKEMFKTYYALCVGKLSENAELMFKEGIKFKDYTAKPAELKILKETPAEQDVCEYELLVEICEGKFHQVKKMVHAVGAEVKYLKRIRIGRVVLDDSLKPGEYRSLTDEELAMLGEVN